MMTDEMQILKSRYIAIDDVEKLTPKRPYAAERFYLQMKTGPDLVLVRDVDYEMTEMERTAAIARAERAEAELVEVKAGTKRLATSVAAALLDKEIDGEIEGGAVLRIAQDTIAELLALRAQLAAATDKAKEHRALLAARLLNPWDTAPVNEHVTVTLTTVGWFTNDGVWDWDDNGCWDVLGWQPLPAAPDAGQK